MSGGPYGRGKAPERTCLPRHRWPQIDRQLWDLALTPVGLLEETGGERVRHRPKSNEKAETGYGRWLTFLSGQGWLDAEAPPSARITRDRVKAYVAKLQALGNKKNTILGRLQELDEVAKVVAPEAELGFLKTIASRVRAMPEVPKDKRSRMVGTHCLIDLGFALMDGAGSQSTPRRAAIMFRDGLLIAMLALVPLRRGNLASLTLGATLIQVGDGWQIAIPAEASKNHDPLDFPWPEMLNAALRTYLEVHRPLLSGQVHRWTAAIGGRLWVSSHGSPLTEMAIYDVIRKRTETAFGEPINPHLFRDEAATAMAIHDPGHVRAAGPLLGHRHQATTERYYQQAQSVEASRAHAKSIAALRSSAKNNGNLT
jgi:integrase